MGWTQAVADLLPGEVVAIHGKTVRRSHDGAAGRRAIHLVSAWASANTLTLGQVKTEEKSNEITAIPRLLAMLELTGCIVTIDAMGCQAMGCQAMGCQAMGCQAMGCQAMGCQAMGCQAMGCQAMGCQAMGCQAMGCQQEIAQGILDREADYVLAVKENQGQLHEDVKDLFEGGDEFAYQGLPHEYATTLDKGHGRVERRECWVISDPLSLEYLSTGKDWPSLRSVVKVASQRHTAEGTTVQPRYYISSLEAPAERLLGVVRTHWSIENSLHWSLDVTFGEDRCRIRKDHAPQNMATLRQVSHNLLKNETSLKVGIQGKRLQAGWKEDYLLKVLRS